jgi:hypothetical protein
MNSNMTHHQLLALVATYLLVVALDAVCNHLFPLPKPIRNIASLKESRVGWSRKLIYAYGLYSFVVLSVGVAGVIGLFLCWHIAPWLFTIAVTRQADFQRYVGAHGGRRSGRNSRVAS